MPDLHHSSSLKTRGSQPWVRALLGWVVFWAFFPTPAAAQTSPVTISHPEASAIFGEQITFQAQIQASQPITSVDLFFQSADGVSTIVGTATYDPVTGTAFYAHDVQTQFVKAFSNLDYWFRVTLEDGSTHTSATFFFFYEDNRFNWQTLDSPPLTVHWYEGDVAFAQTILDIGQRAILEFQTLIPAPLPERLDIYVYASLLAYQYTQGQLGQQWAGGHADPNLAIVFVSLRPGPEQRLQLEREVPHEIAHIMLFQATGTGFYTLPLWLNEGIASNMEFLVSPDYNHILDDAKTHNTLIPLGALCRSFPREAPRALLSYAQATSFVRYLHTQYGNPGIQALVNQYASGVGCEVGTLVAPIGKPLAEIERAWLRAVFQESARDQTLAGVQSGLILLAALVFGPLIVTVGGRFRSKDKRAENL